MIKKILLALVVALPMCAWAQAPKFGIVDVESIIPKMTEFVEAQNKLSEASKTYETEYAKINEELQKFNPELARRPMLVAGNKCDLATEEQIETFRRFTEEQGYEFFPIMAPIRQGVDELMNAVLARLSQLPPILRYEAEPPVLEPVEALSRGKVEITCEDGVYFVKAPWLLKIMNTVNFDETDSLQYFQRVLIQTGVIDALREAGVQEGDTVDLYDLEFDFIE